MKIELNFERMEMKTGEEDEPNEIVSSPANHGKQWRRGRFIGKGTYGSVYLATSNPDELGGSDLPLVMAVKSAEVRVSETLQNEKIAYDYINNGCASLIKCFGEEITFDESGRMIYNLLLEFAPGGTLADQIKESRGKGLPENDVKRYTRSILRGLIHMHQRNYVHCDLKPQNILLVRNSNNSRCVAKIADLGFAKRMNKTKKHVPAVRGTPLYMAPEAVLHSVQEPPADVWALGCVVLEMLTGKRAWGTKTDDKKFMHMISGKYEVPKIPSEISKEGKEFLNRCFVKSPGLRFTAEMLLSLPFVAPLEEEEDSAEHEERTGYSKRQTTINLGGGALTAIMAFFFIIVIFLAF